MNGSVTHRTHRWVLLAAAVVVSMLSAVTPAMGQFGAGAYGSLVWDPDKQCWVMIDRNGFARRLVDE